ncbi:hypothetical protein BGZ81_008703 [Podila clonocystis]|nr:hypothetical protein BGZ81_008703 [Podila clonocystis]
MATPTTSLTAQPLHDLLHSQIPQDMVHMNKRRASYEQDDDAIKDKTPKSLNSAFKGASHRSRRLRD